MLVVVVVDLVVVVVVVVAVVVVAGNKHCRLIMNVWCPFVCPKFHPPSRP